MLTAERILRKEAVNRRVSTERLDQFDLAVRRINEADLHTLCGHVERLMNLHRPHDITPMGDAVGDRRRCDADMIEAAEVHNIRFP